MNYCPECGKKLFEKDRLKQCECGFVDWDNWVYTAAVAVGYNEKGEFAMVTLKGKEEGALTFPGGFRNLGETLEEAATREFYEESGYFIADLKLFSVYTLDSRRLVWIVFTGTITGGAFAENDETSKTEFFSTKHLPKDETLRGSLTRRLLADLIQNG